MFNQELCVSRTKKSLKMITLKKIFNLRRSLSIKSIKDDKNNLEFNPKSEANEEKSRLK